jgi:hypothetical protein
MVTSSARTTTQEKNIEAAAKTNLAALMAI